ncbi:MAG TPA: hypothetical protein VGR35_06475 [Tepidisphaeraceae bacterium]|nr:hypothetical protein [Tepidisphaeraceae bacterium]
MSCRCLLIVSLLIVLLLSSAVTRAADAPPAPTPLIGLFVEQADIPPRAGAGVDGTVGEGVSRARPEHRGRMACAIG